MLTINIVFGIVVWALSLIGISFVPGLFGRANFVVLEIFMATSAVFGLVAHTFALPWYAARALSVDPAALGESFGTLTDTRMVLAIDLVVTGTHLALPVRISALVIVEVASLLCYVAPTWGLGGPEMEDAPLTAVFLLCLIGAAACGKRSLEYQERVMFLKLIREKSLRFQSEFALSQHQLAKFRQQGAGAPSEPSEAEKESLPSTTESGRVFSVHRSDISRKLIDELADIGSREQWLIRPGEVLVVPGRLLGEGAFGRVVLARYQGIHVALKVPKVHDQRITDNSHLVEMCDELRVLRRIRHPNVVLFYGATLDEQHRHMALVLEFVDGVSVRSFVRGWRRDDGGDSGPVPPSAIEKSQVLADVACALQYLHSRTPPIIHGDLKDRNVFVEVPRARVSVRAKLLDFGLARVLTRHAKPMGGTMCWVAPELLWTMGTATSTAADVFSFGRLAYFVVTGRLPFHNTMAENIETAVAQLVAPLEWPPDSQLGVRWRPLVERCSREEASERPGMRQVYGLATDCLGKLLESEASELPLDIAHLIARGQASGDAQAADSAGRPQGSNQTRLATSTTGTSQTARADAPAVPLARYATTPDSTAILLLMETIASLSLQIPPQSCCEFHGTVRSTGKLLASLIGEPCKRWDSLDSAAGLIIGQCSQCGVLMRNSVQDSSSSSTLPAIFECRFCEHQQPWREG
ncbi:unnamed protein product [Prorocentrum cordatum]|uniref:Protein kinase domain-containing protein n=1 Tax=Prorocentrum cordatum TaxID=2364126 RepID=A0ABN9QVD7_9DINO|nr:unnamed protein product [Polarella glacialis]